MIPVHYEITMTTKALRSYVAEQRMRCDPPPNRVCKQHQRGACRYGKTCRYMHTGKNPA